MERDRAAVLTIKAAVEGVIDYRNARLHDANWWRYWRYMLQGLENQTDEKLIRLAFDFHLALISNGNISADDFKKLQRESKELFKDYEGNLRSWLGRNQEDRHHDLAKTFKQQWQDFTGFDLDDPVALAQWENKLETAMEADNQADKARREQQAQQEQTIRDRIEQIKQLRLNQRGRR